MKTKSSSLGLSIHSMHQFAGAMPTLSDSYFPATFVERGVAVPFTTPMLEGTRARPSPRGRIELIVPNLSGGRGVYVFPTSGITQLCRPTVHDMRLTELVGALAQVTPGSIRHAARYVAGEGLAGREACAAAKAAAASEADQLAFINIRLALQLLDHMEPGRLTRDMASVPDMENEARGALARIAPKFGMPVGVIADALEQLARVFLPIGLPGQSCPARLVRLMDQILHLRDAAAEWRKASKPEEAAHALSVAIAADATLRCAMRTLADGHGATKDIRALIELWRLAPIRLARRIARTEWVLDGWEQICIIWSCADSDHDRRESLADMVVLLPVLPREVSTWTGGTIDIDAVNRLRKPLLPHADWRTSAVFDRIARNEKARALAA